MKGGSGEHDDARDTGLLSKEAFDKEGVGGPLSDGDGDGDLDREPGEFPSSKGRKAKRDFGLASARAAWGRCERLEGWWERLER